VDRAAAGTRALGPRPRAASEFGTFDDHVYVGTISDDGTFAGSTVIAGTAAVWRCG
jgi:hypothetical protein